MYTDTPPLIAVPLKYLTFWSDSDFQYTGIQVLVSTYLLVYFSTKCLSAIRVSTTIALAGGLLIATAPFLVFRDEFHHYSLNIIWAISAGVLLVLTTSNRFPTYSWSALFFVTLTWMPYFAAPLAMLWLPSLILSSRRIRRNWPVWLRDIGTPLVAILAAMLVDGFWHNADASGDFGLGYYNANLTALVNPLATQDSTWSLVLPTIPHATAGQYEGFAFLGIGGLSLAILALGLFVTHPALRKAQFRSRKGISLTVSVIVALLAATALSWDIGPVHLASVTLPDAFATVMSIFRSSGRFMLLVAIAALIWSVAVVGRSLRAPIALALVLVAVCATWIDSSHGIDRNKAQEQDQSQLTTGMVAAGEFIDRNDIRRVSFVLPEDSAYSWKMDILAATAVRNIPTNDAFVARPNLAKLTDERDAMAAQFAAGKIPAGEAWAIYPEFASAHRAELVSLLAHHCWLGLADAYLVASSRCP